MFEQDIDLLISKLEPIMKKLYELKATCPRPYKSEPKYQQSTPEWSKKLGASVSDNHIIKGIKKQIRLIGLLPGVGNKYARSMDEYNAVNSEKV